MNQKLYSILACFCLWALFSSCEKDKEPLLDLVPHIEVQSLSPTSLVQFEDNVELILYYEDGDGDLGHENPDSLTLEVQDSRLTTPDRYHIQPLSPPDTEIPIQGTIKVALNSTFLLGNGMEEVITYTIRLRDQAGNWSNSVVTENITVLKE